MKRRITRRRDWKLKIAVILREGEEGAERDGDHSWSGGVDEVRVQLNVGG